MFTGNVAFFAAINVKRKTGDIPNTAGWLGFMIFHNLCFLPRWHNYYNTPNNFQVSYFPDQANNDDKDVPGFILCGFGKADGVAIYIR